MTPIRLAAVLASLSFALPAMAQDKLTLILDWYVNPDHAPIIGMARSMMKPGVPLSMRKAVMPSCRLPSPVRAMRMMKSDRGTLETQILRPLMTHWPPSFTARVVIPAGSPPAPGSEIAMAERCSPRA